MAQKTLFHFISPDFVKDIFDSLSSTDKRDIAIIVPVFYNRKVDFSYHFNGNYCSIRGSVFDLMSHLRSRFSPYAKGVYKFKYTDIVSLYTSYTYKLFSPIPFEFFNSGRFKYFFVVCLSKL